MTGRSRARVVASAVLLAPLVLGVVAQQWNRYETARQLLRETRAHCDEALLQVRAAERHQKELEHEIQLTEADLARLIEILPLSLEADEFAAHVRKRADAAKVTFVENDFRMEEDAAAPSGTLSAVLKGDEETLEAFTDRIHRWSRLVKYQELDRGEGWRLCMLTTWAAPEEDDEEVDDFPMPAGLPWLPPFSSFLARERARVEGAVHDVEAHREILGRVRHYEHEKHRLEQMVDLINELKNRVEAAAAGSEKKAGTAARWFPRHLARRMTPYGGRPWLIPVASSRRPPRSFPRRFLIGWVRTSSSSAGAKPDPTRTSRYSDSEASIPPGSCVPWSVGSRSESWSFFKGTSPCRRCRSRSTSALHHEHSRAAGKKGA